MSWKTTSRTFHTENKDQERVPRGEGGERHPGAAADL